MRRIALLVLVPLLSLLPARADALTVRDILELTRAGLGEEILLTLIDVDRSVFPIDTATLKRLKEAGVSERVILAMIRSARMPALTPEPIPVVEPASAPEPQVIVIEHHDPPQIREVPVAVPIYLPFVTRTGHQGSVARRQDFVQRREDFVQDAFAPPSELDRFAGTSVHTQPVKPAEPVYWGFGGKLRPDAWQPSPDPTIRAPEPTIKKKQNER